MSVARAARKICKWCARGLVPLAAHGVWVCLACDYAGEHGPLNG
jgi:ribosomal protein L37AE/L43A